MNTRKASVSIVTINYNQLHHTLALLESLQHLTYPDVEIIVVDNHSRENPEQPIKERYPGVKVVLSEDNLGFAGGNNLGTSVSTGEYILYLNNDTEVDPSFLEPLVTLFERNPKAGAASSKILYYNSDNIIQYAGSTCINPFTGRNKRVGWMEKDEGQYDTLAKTDLAHGCAMMVPRKVINQVGPMPELFFLYYEEIDWCESIKRAGFDIYYVPQSRVYHKESMSVGKNSTLKTYYMTRNRLLYMRRNITGHRRLLSMLFFLTFSAPKNLATFVMRREAEHLRAFWRACAWNITHLSNGEKFRLFS